MAALFALFALSLGKFKSQSIGTNRYALQGLRMNKTEKLERESTQLTSHLPRYLRWIWLISAVAALGAFIWGCSHIATITPIRITPLLTSLAWVLTCCFAFGAIGLFDLAKDSKLGAELKLDSVGKENYVLSWMLVGLATAGILLLPFTHAMGLTPEIAQDLKEFAGYCIQVGGFGAISLRTLLFSFKRAG